MTQRLKQLYFESIAPTLLNTSEYCNTHQVPRLKKIVINCGIGEASQNAKCLESTLEELSLIAGQKAVVRKARKAIAGFKIREGVPVGACVTVRGDAMYAFLDRLINLALPRIRDFQGLNPQSFDSYGNFHLGLQEQLVFPELDFDKIERVRGMDVCVVTTAKSKSEALVLLKALGMPFQGASAL
uniref:ribosomal protein L5 n=1 Tax=Streptosarcina arenaria TaxID=2058782 RepID=UPI00286D1DB7|nr:ribosomal protein L5 [Streptosarcina arenaria]WKT08850.1 ribosomal protein L5 [Streptosarcina arenaria]